jgi:hypothetical protein
VALNWGIGSTALNADVKARQAPQCARYELRVSEPELEIVDLPGQVLRCV